MSQFTQPTSSKLKIKSSLLLPDESGKVYGWKTSQSLSRKPKHVKKVAKRKITEGR